MLAHAQPACESEVVPADGAVDAPLCEDAEDLVRDADKIMEDLVLQAPAGVDLNAIVQWKRRVKRYFG